MKPQKQQCRYFVSILSVIATGLSLWITPVHAQTPAETKQDEFGNAAFVFAEDTVIEFEVKESHGAYQTTVGVVNLDTNEQTVLFQESKPYDGYTTGEQQSSSPGQNNTGTAIDYLGTVEGGTIVTGTGEATALTDFTFKARTRYSLYIESVSPTGQTRRTVQAIDVNAAQFQGGLNAGQTSEVIGTRIYWDDQGLPRSGKDSDFDDFVLEAGGYLLTVPCPPLK